MKPFETIVHELLIASDELAPVQADDLRRLIDLARGYRQALVTLSTHDFTSVTGCARGQLVAAKALRGEK